MPEARAHANKGMQVNFGGPKALTIFPLLNPNTLPSSCHLEKLVTMATNRTSPPSSSSAMATTSPIPPPYDSSSHVEVPRHRPLGWDRVATLLAAMGASPEMVRWVSKQMLTPTCEKEDWDYQGTLRVMLLAYAPYTLKQRQSFFCRGDPPNKVTKEDVIRERNIYAQISLLSDKLKRWKAITKKKKPPTSPRGLKSLKEARALVILANLTSPLNSK